jgi:tyrosine-protein kinase Etk/Wzc
LHFIDNELKGISDSLNISEKELQEFKTKNGMLSLDEESKQIFEDMSDLQEQES